MASIVLCVVAAVVVPRWWVIGVPLTSLLVYAAWLVAGAPYYESFDEQAQATLFFALVVAAIGAAGAVASRKLYGRRPRR